MYGLILGFVLLIFLVWYFRPKVRYFIYNNDAAFKRECSKILASTEWRKIFEIEEVQTLNESNVDIKLVEDSFFDSNYKKKQEYYADGSPIRFSITKYGGPRKNIFINKKNWEGVPQSGLNLKQYREYVINHEFGHALGFDHLPCNEKTVVNGVCPVMYQSTRGHDKYKCGYKPSSVDFNSTSKLW